MKKGYIAVDLDGTLAMYAGWVSEPLLDPLDHQRDRRPDVGLADGKDVRIFTARVSGRKGAEHARAIWAIENWSLEHIGVKLPVTCCKDFAMMELWDDRAVQVVPNTGQRVDGSLD